MTYCCNFMGASNQFLDSSEQNYQSGYTKSLNFDQFSPNNFQNLHTTGGGHAPRTAWIRPWLVGGLR